MPVSAAKIKELLGNGLSNEVVATAMGVHPSYISQLMSDETFYAEVVERRTQSLTAATERDRSWNGIEEKLLNKLHEHVDAGMIFKPNDVLRALMVANNAKRRGSTVSEAAVNNSVVVNLTLPPAVIKAYKKNVTGEVVEVIDQQGNQQTLVTMPASALLEKLSTTTNKEVAKKYDEVRKFLPSGSQAKNP